MSFLKKTIKMLAILNCQYILKEQLKGPKV